MKVATWQGENRFTIDEVPEPAPAAGQVLVQGRGVLRATIWSSRYERPIAWRWH